jgi:hypothetical protein
MGLAVELASGPHRGNQDLETSVGYAAVYAYLKFYASPLGYRRCRWYGGGAHATLCAIHDTDDTFSMTLVWARRGHRKSIPYYDVPGARLLTVGIVVSPPMPWRRKFITPPDVRCGEFRSAPGCAHLRPSPRCVPRKSPATRIFAHTGVPTVHELCTA